ncbi:hypothetical protein LIER_21070 [Lithospermum erythrorhizon]|uniref:Uncharacterized protein n=1 Tax=Lithospermum erythrorhizon TaxID=34254 RepID=A0AAV3QRB3_LITER
MRRLSDIQERLAEAQDHILRRLDAQEARQKKDQKYIKGIMKFLSCFGKGEGFSSEAQKYLVHSDSDPEGDEQQTVSGTPVRAEDYGFHHNGGMGFFSGP